MSLLDVLGSVVTGGATGILGSALSRVFSFFENKQKFKHEIDLLAANREFMREEAKYRLEEAELRGRIELYRTEEEARGKYEASANMALSESYKDSAVRWSKGDSPWIVFVDVLRGVTRPSLTVFLCVVVFVMWGYTESADLETQIVATVLYMATAAVLWWFGSRPSTYNKVK